MLVKFFFTRLVILSFVLAVLIFLSSLLNFFPEVTNFNWWNLGFFSILTLLSILLLARGINQGNSYRFVNAVMLSFTVKIFISIGYFLAIYFIFHVNPKLFLISFAIFYLIFSVFETILMANFSSGKYKLGHAEQDRTRKNSEGLRT